MLANSTVFVILCVDNDSVVNPSTIVIKFTVPIWFACLEYVASTVMHKL